MLLQKFCKTMTVPNSLRHIPNTLTLLNLVAGCLAIISTLEGYMHHAAYLLVLASILDFLDGFVARALRVYSALGRELDSLADVVSFGVAPSVILYLFLKESLGIPAHEGFVHGNAILCIPMVMAAFSALRLAKFNIDTRQTLSFIGLPTPANALLVVGLVFGLNSPHSQYFSYFVGSPGLLIGLTLVLSALLVSPIPMFSLKVKSLRFAEAGVQMVFIILSCIIIFILGKAALTPIMLLYILICLIRWPFGVRE